MSLEEDVARAIAQEREAIAKAEASEQETVRRSQREAADSPFFSEGTASPLSASARGLMAGSFRVMVGS